MISCFLPTTKLYDARNGFEPSHLSFFSVFVSLTASTWLMLIYRTQHLPPLFVTLQTLSLRIGTTVILYLTKKLPLKNNYLMAVLEGFEPSTNWLTANCSTTELKYHITDYCELAVCKGVSFNLIYRNDITPI